MIPSEGCPVKGSFLLLFQVFRLGGFDPEM